MVDMRNRSALNAELRDRGRGGLLDRHHGETGLAQSFRPGDRKDLLQLSADNRTDPQVVTVGFSVSELSPPAKDGTVDGRLRGHLSWATGRGEASAVIDLRNGGQVTLAANTLNMAVHYGGTVGAAFKVSAFVAYGSRRGACQPAVTFTDDAVSPGDSGAVLSPGRKIPAFATAVAWSSAGDALGASPPAATLRMVTDRQPGAVVVAQASPSPLVFVPIPNGAHFIELRNDGGGGERYSLLYELSL